MTDPWADDAELEELEHSPTSAEEKAQLFQSEEEREWHRYVNEKLKLENEQFSRDMGNREKFADRAYGVTQAWVGFVIVVTLAQFSLGKSKYFGLGDQAFMVVVTSTTASVFGFWLLVGQYLFHRPQIGKDKRKRPKAPMQKKALRKVKKRRLAA